MNITVETLPDCKASIRVEIPREKVETQRAQITKLYHQNASVPGFRPGKAPAAMIARRYAKQIEQELKDRLTAEGYQEGSKKDGLEVLSPTDVKDSSFNEDGTFSFVVEVITVPQFELPELKGITIKVPKLEITDATVDQAIDGLREREADYIDVEGRAAQAGDVVVIDYHGFIEGKPVRELAPKAVERLQEGADFWVLLKEPNFLPGFTDGLIGQNAGETRQVTVKLPDDFQIKDIAGKEIIYEVALKEVKEQKLPELNDEFARNSKIADDVPALREAVRAYLQKDLQQKIEQSKREQVIQHLNEATTFDVPQDLLNQATHRRARELVQANQQRGVSEEEIIENQEQILDAAGQQAQFDVKTNFILNKIAEKEDISATNEDIQQELMAYAMRVRANKSQMQKIVKNQSAIQRFRENVVVRKTLDLLISNAAIEEVDPPAEESGETAPA